MMTQPLIIENGEPLKILITGADSQCSPAIAGELLLRGHQVREVIKDQFDITNLNIVNSCSKTFGPEYEANVIINLAAQSSADFAEVYPAETWLTNVVGPLNLAELAEFWDAKLINFSSDFVFSGTTGCGYVESDRPWPINTYGKTKAVCDDALKDFSYVATIRPSWILGPRYVAYLRRQARKFSCIELPGPVTTAKAITPACIGEFICWLISGNHWDSGVWHLAHSPIMKRTELLDKLLQHLKLNVPVKVINETQPARRPLYTPLVCRRAVEAGFDPGSLDDWLETIS
jgi:dTDP-4-dehydrorhamnose reductase